jgi:hypothetical protein
MADLTKNTQRHYEIYIILLLAREVVTTVEVCMYWSTVLDEIRNLVRSLSLSILINFFFLIPVCWHQCNALFKVSVTIYCFRDKDINHIQAKNLYL